LVFHEPLLVFAESARIEGLLLQFQVQKPLEEQVVAQPFAEGPFGGHAKKRHQEPRTQQALRRDGGPADLAVHRLEARVQTAEDFIAQTFNFPDGVVFGDPGIDVDHGHELPLRLLLASHAHFYPIRLVHTRFIFCFSSSC
jgi:hypothetical protein